MSEQRCGYLDDVVAELALGLLDGAQRADALAHIERCSDCQAEVAALTAAGEKLLLLAPEVPPPAGFESRVLARLVPAPEGLSPLGPSGAGRAESPGRPGRWGRRGRRRADGAPRRTGFLVAAAVVVVALAAVGALLGPLGSDGGGGGGGGGSDLAVATVDMINPRGDVVGDAILWDRPPETVMELDVRDWLDAAEENGAQLDDPWWLSVETDDGTVDMYRVELTRAEPSEVTLRSGPDEVVAVSLVDDDGRTWCSGRLPA